MLALVTVKLRRDNFNYHKLFSFGEVLFGKTENDRANVYHGYERAV